jgi:hypothetical protein
MTNKEQAMKKKEISTDTIVSQVAKNGVKSAVDCYTMSFLCFLRGPSVCGLPI